MHLVLPLASMSYAPFQSLKPGDLFHLGSEHGYPRTLAMVFSAGPNRTGSVELAGDGAFTMRNAGRNPDHHVIPRPVTELVVQMSTAPHEPTRMWNGGTLFLTPEAPMLVLTSTDGFGDREPYFLSLRTWEVSREYPAGRYTCVTDWALLDRTARGDELIFQVGNSG